MSLPTVSLNKFKVICRGCLKETQALTSLYDESIEANLVTKFQSLTSVQLDENYGLPEKLCQSCMKELLAANNFASKCKISDATLRKCLIQHHNSVMPQMEHEQYLGCSFNANTLTVGLSDPEDDFTNDLSFNHDLKTTLISKPDMFNANTNSIVTAKKIHKTEIIYDVEPSEMDYMTENFEIGYDPVTNNSEDYNPNVDISFVNCEEFNKSQSNIDPLSNNLRELRIQLVRVETNENSSGLDSQNKNNQINFKHANTIKQSPLNGQNERYSCEMCPNTYRRFSSLNHHKQSHEADFKDNAASASNENKYDDSLETGSILHRASFKKKYKCDRCDKPYHFLHALEKHKMFCSVECKYKCNVCFKLFPDRSTLNIHKNVHIKNQKFTCDVCSKTMSSVGSLTRHKLTHTGEKPFSCPICKKTFNISYNLYLHKRVHTGKKPYACDACGQRFLWKHNLLRHKIIHTDNMPFSCSVCKNKFRYAHSLKIHEIRMHGINHG